MSTYCKPLIFISYQHGGPEIKFLLELCDENMYIHKVICVHIFHFSDDVRHPLKLLLCTSHPQEVNLSTQHENLTKSCTELGDLT